MNEQEAKNTAKLIRKMLDIYAMGPQESERWYATVEAVERNTTKALLAAYTAGVKAGEDKGGYRAGFDAGLNVVKCAPPGHIIDDAGNVRKVRMQAVFVGGTVPCAIPLKPGETVMALEAAEAARKEGQP